MRVWLCLLFTRTALVAAGLLALTTTGAAQSVPSLWLGNDHEGDVFQVDTLGRVLRRIPSLPVTGIAFDGTSLYFSDNLGNITQRSADGTIILKRFTVPVTSGKSAEDAAWDSKRGRLWIITRDLKLLKIDPAAGRVEQTFALPDSDPTGEVSGLEGVGLAYNPGRDVLYVTVVFSDYYSSYSFVRIVNPANGAIVGEAFGYGDYELYGLAYDPATDTIWAGDHEKHIRHFNMSGNLLSVFSQPGPAGPADGLEFVASTGSASDVYCGFTPFNSFLGFHSPGLHAPGSPNQAHMLSVDVVSGGAPAALTDVTITSARPVFSTDPSAPPTLTTLSLRTDTNGRVRFSANPPGGSGFDRYDLEARGSVGGKAFSCSGSVTIGLGTISAASTVATTTAAINRFSSMAGQIAGDYLSPFSNAFQSVFGGRPPEPAEPRTAPRFTAADSPDQEAVIARLKGQLGTRNRLNVPATSPVRAFQEAYGSLPLSFEPNGGQVGDASYYARGTGYRLYLNAGEMMLVDDSAGAGPDSAPLRIRMAGADPSARLTALDELPGKTHYLVGGNPARWRTAVPRYAKVRCEGVYPGIDLVFHGYQRLLEFDYVVAPGATVGRIDLAFDGTDRLQTNEAGGLLFERGQNRFRMERPVIYQDVGGVRKEIAGRYVVRNGNHVGFEVGPYDRARPLVIDPVVSYASYLGGGLLDGATAVAVDPQGSVYITGATSSANFPTAGGVQPGFAGVAPHADVFVTKFDSTGTTVLYSTYVGGTSNDAGLGIAVDSAGNAYVTGVTLSADFPVSKALQPAYGGAGDAFAFKLNPSGSGFVYSTFLGGAGADGARAVAVDSAGNAYIAGATSSMNFPVKNAFQSVNRGNLDAFVTKLNPAGETVYSTYLGGNGLDVAAGLAIDGAGNAYVTGATESTDFPLLGALQQANRGYLDGFVAKLGASGSALLYSTYLGGSSDDFGTAIAVDGSGNSYVTGLTGSTDFPLQGAAQNKPGSARSLGLDAFVTKLASNGQAIVYSTFLGGSGTEMGLAIAVSADGTAYVAGESDSADFPAVNPSQPAPSGLSDGFLTKLAPSGSSFAYSTTVGGSGYDSIAGLALHASGVYAVGTSMSNDAPVTYGAYQTEFRGPTDALVMKIVEGTPAPRIASVSAATFRPGGPVAAEAIVAGFGQGLASGTQIADVIPLPTSLLNVSVKVRDSGGGEQLAPLFFVSPGQINYLVPAGIANGLATVTVTSGAQTSATGTLRVDIVSPGLFSANADGQGVAAAVAVKVAAGGAQSSQVIFQCGTAPGSCVPAPLDMGAETDQLFLLLFGTGIRGRSSLSSVTVSIGGVAVPMQYAGPQGQLAGLDQVNIGPLPGTLRGRGQMDIQLVVDGKTANTVTVNIR